MRQFYTIIQKGAPLEHQLNISWTNWKYLLPIKNENERNYYINQCILNNLSKRELAKLIKEKGRGFSSDDILKAWTSWQTKDKYYTAELRAYINYIN